MLAVLVTAALVLGHATEAYSAPGDLDPFFGAGGKATTDLGQKDGIQAVAVQPTDGKTVALGRSYDTATNTTRSYLARYKTDGALDTGFGSGGTADVDFDNGTGSDLANDLALQSDGKIVVAGGYGTDFALARYNPDGSPDDGTPQDSTPGDEFGTDGRVITSFTPSFDVAYAVALQADGKIVAAGYTATSSDSFGNRYSDFAVARYNPDGTLDTTFDGDGWVFTNASVSNTGHDNAYDVGIQPDGKIVAAGRSTGSNSTDFTLLRYNADGSRDDGGPGDSGPGDAFGTGGKAVIHFGVAYALAVQPDGKILAAGPHGGDFLLARFTGSGSPDVAFGEDKDGDGLKDGRVTTGFDAPGGGSFDTVDIARGVVLQSDGKIVVAGGSQDGSVGPGDFALARYDSDGAPDPTFSGDGKLTTALAGDDAAYGLALHKDGKVVAAGTSAGDFAVARYYGGSDTVPPKVVTAAPAGTGVFPKTNVSATFSEAMIANTLRNPTTLRSTTFTLRRAGTTTQVAAKVTYYPASKKAVLNPDSDLRRGTTYVAAVTPAAKDLTGNALDGNPAVAGNQPKIWKFTVR